MNFFPFHVGDYAVHTRHLSLMEDLAYRRMLDLYYTTEKPLPSAEQTARLIGMREHVAEVSAVLADFFVERDGVYVQSRCDAEIGKYHKKADSARNANQARWSSVERLKSDADQIPTKNQEPRTKEIHGSVSTELPASDKPTPPLKAKDLIAEGVDPQAAADWLALRKAKRLPLTATAWDDTRAEGRKCSLTPAQTVAMAVANNWAGFKASWLTKDAPRSGQPQKRDIYEGLAI